MMKMQMMLSNGAWINDDRVEMFVGLVVERETWFAPRLNRPPMDAAGVMAALAAGQELRYDNDWYANIRDGEVHERMMTARKAAKAAEAALVLCDCGHRTAHPMTASMGTSCPDCYDVMS